MPTNKWFAIAQEGATADGREIKREWLVQCAKNYDPAVYGARLNLEHLAFYYYCDDAHSKRYGDVVALKTDEVNGKLKLFAQISPNKSLLELNKADQKVYTSAEIDTSFADTNEAYLVGLALTDSPASLGTDKLKFNRNQTRLFTDCLAFNLGELMPNQTQNEPTLQAQAQEAEKPSLLNRFKAMFTEQKNTQDEIETVILELAQKQKDTIQTLENFAKALDGVKEINERLTVELSTTREELKAMQEKFAQTPAEVTATPVITGHIGDTPNDFAY